MPPTDEHKRDLFAYDFWPSRAGEWEGGPKRGTSAYDNIDFHVDLGCGRLPKGRIGVDRYPAPGVSVVADLETMTTHGIPRAPGEDAAVPIPGGHGYQLWDGSRELEYHDPARMERYVVENPGRLPFADDSIESIISHHFFEHVGEGFIPLMDDIYRVLKPGGILRVITPLFPSWSAVSDPDHRRYFMADDGGPSTWDVFCGTPGADDDPSSCWLASFSVPYTTARFEKVHQDMSPPAPPELAWTPRDARELRVALKAVK